MKLYLPEDDPLLSELRNYSHTCVRFFPHSGNLGDGLITYATIQLFEHFGINYTTHRQHERFDGQVIIVGGGGNMVEGSYEDVAELIWAHRETNKVILLPQTIVGYDDIIKETHNNLTIFCREKLSFEHCLAAGGRKDRIHLCQDAALYLTPEHFEQSEVLGQGCLSAMRTDSEALGEKRPPNNIDVSLAWNGDVWTSPAFVKAAVISMVEFISQYRQVKTDRLHVAIISALLGREVTMHPNNYFKNRAVFEHSIKRRFNNVVFDNSASTTSGTPALAEVRKDSIQSLQKRLERERDLHDTTRRKFRLQMQQLTEKYKTNTDCLKAELSALKSKTQQIGEETNNDVGHKVPLLTAEIASLREQLEILRSSKSWRYTEPLRKFRSFFKF